MKRTLFAAVSLLALAGCASAASSSSTTDPGVAAAHSSAVAAQQSAEQAIASAAAGQPSSSPVPSTTAQMVAACTSHSCLTQEAEATLPGEQASDGSVITKATCYQSSVKHSAPGIFTVSCEATYTDGSVWQGIATIQPAADQFSWQPQYQVS